MTSYCIDIRYPVSGTWCEEEQAIQIAESFQGKRGDSGTDFTWRDLEFVFPSRRLGEFARDRFASEGFSIVRIVQEEV